MSNVLYLEHDEDITSAIDKLGKVEGSEVRVVVPKRSGLLASLINLKLLKKAAAESKKKLILITTDPAISNLASRVDLAVAENVNAAAAVPDADKLPNLSEAAEEIEEDEPAPKPAPTKIPVQAAEMASPLATREVPDETPEPKAPEKPTEKPAKIKKVPDFNSFQKRALNAVWLLAIIVVLLGLSFWLQSANIVISAKGTQIPTDTTFKAITDGGTADPAAGQVRADTLTDTQNVSKNFPATGKKDAGTKASGTVTVTNYCFNPGSIKAGTVFTASGLRFVATQTVAIANATPQFGSCPNPTTASVPVAAAANGDNYNLAPTTYSVGGYSQSELKGTGNQMSGGTTKQLNVVSAADIASAKAKLAAADDQTKNDLASKAPENELAAKGTFNASVSDLTPSPAVGTEADTFSVTATVKYTMLAFDRQNLNDLISSQASVKVGQDNQIYDAGLNSATIKPLGGGSFDFSTTVYAGAKLDVNQLKNTVKGLKLGDAGAKLEQMPGIDKAEISLSPFWVTSVPRLTSHIHIQIKVVSSSG